MFSICLFCLYAVFGLLICTRWFAGECTKHRGVTAVTELCFLAAGLVFFATGNCLLGFAAAAVFFELAFVQMKEE